jgi:hypothetical protein
MWHPGMTRGQWMNGVESCAISFLMDDFWPNKWYKGQPTNIGGNNQEKKRVLINRWNNDHGYLI